MRLETKGINQDEKNKLIKLFKTKGELVEVMPLGSNFLFCKAKYKANLGAIYKKNWHGAITNVYLIYEDWDGSVKYYDYPQITEKLAKTIYKEIAKLIKLWRL